MPNPIISKSEGFGGLLVATVIVAIMYIGLCFSSAELSPALPHTGGAYSFGRTAFGPWASQEPLFLALRTIFGEGAGSTLLSLAAVAGLVASFHAIIYAYGRNIYSLSRAGYFPKWMSITHPTRKTPHVALIVGAVAGYGVALVIEYGSVVFGDVPVGGVLLNMAVFGLASTASRSGLRFRWPTSVSMLDTESCFRRRRSLRWKSGGKIRAQTRAAKAAQKVIARRAPTVPRPA